MTIRCSQENCNKKLKILNFGCKCGLSFCLKHKMPELHSCNFDHRMIEDLSQKIENSKCVAEKIKSI